MAKFADFIEKGKKASQTKGGKRTILYGTGLRKRKLETAQKQADKIGMLSTTMTAEEKAARIKALLAKDIDKIPDRDQVIAGQEQKAQPVTPKTLKVTVPTFPDKAIEEHQKAQRVAEEHAKTLRVTGIPEDLELDESQKRALEGLSKQQFGCLIGAAGTGKTLLTNLLVRKLEETTPIIDLNDAGKEIADKDRKYNIAMAFCAFTGRAVQQLKRALDKEYHPLCDTIHGTLGFHPETYTVFDKKLGKHVNKVKWVPRFDAANKLPYRVYIIDEGSMVPIDLWNYLRDAMRDDARVFIIGDINQLPPVMGRSVLGYAMNKWPTYELQHIHRNAGVIVKNAHKVLNGLYPEKVENVFDIVNLGDGSLGAFDTTIKVVKWMTAKKQFDPFADGLIVPQNKSILGQLYINEQLVPFFNPEKQVDGVTINKRVLIDAARTQHHFAVGDKVMLLANDRPRMLTNGMVGIITEINFNGRYNEDRGKFERVHVDLTSVSLDKHAIAQALQRTEQEAEKNDKAEKDEMDQRQASHVATVQFADGRTVQFSTCGDYSKITHAYAFTCHKSQGGEYPTVLISMHSSNSRMLSREWLYTAITRAQKRVVLMCNERGLAQALKRQNIKGKTLQEKIASFNLIEDQTDKTVPNLPEAREYDI